MNCNPTTGRYLGPWLYDGPAGAAVTLSVAVSSGGEPVTSGSANPWRFPNRLPVGTSYSISVASEPADLTCFVQYPTGVISATTSPYVVVYCGPRAWSSVAAAQISAVGVASTPPGTLWVWGASFTPNNLGLGADPGGETVPSPTQIGTDTDWSQAAAGGTMYAAIKADQSLWVWGNNGSDPTYGYNGSGLGDGLQDSLTQPTQITTPANTWAQVGIGCDSFTAIDTNGRLWQWGWNDAAGTQGPLVPTQVGTDTNWASVSSGCGDVVILKQDGSAFVWGADFPASASGPQALGAGMYFSSAGVGDANLFLVERSTGVLWGMGANTEGELGLGSVTAGGDDWWDDQPTLVQAATAVPSGHGNWVSVGVGTGQSTNGSSDTVGAVNAAGELWTWGNNYNGQLGVPSSCGTTYNSSCTPANSATPQLVGTTYTQFISSGQEAFSFGLMSDGSLWSWGYDNGFVLGYGGNSYNNPGPSLVP